MANIGLGNLFYTISINKSDLERVKKEVREVTEEVQKSQKAMTEPSGGIKNAFRELRNEIRTLGNEAQILNKKFESEKIGPDQYKVSAMQLEKQLRGLERELENMGDDLDAVGADALSFTAALKDVATIQEQLIRRTERLGNEFEKVTPSLKGTQTAIKLLAAEFKNLMLRSGEMDPKDFADELGFVKMRAQDLADTVDLLGLELNQTESGMLQTTRMLNDLTGITQKASRALDDMSASSNTSSDRLVTYSAHARKLASIMEDLRQKIKRGEGDNATLAAELQNVESRARGVQQAIEKYGSQLATTDERAAQLASVNASLSKTLTNASLAANQLAAGADKASARLDELGISSNSIRRAIKSLEEQFKSNDLTAEELTQRYKVLGAELERNLQEQRALASQIPKTTAAGDRYEKSVEKTTNAQRALRISTERLTGRFNNLRMQQQLAMGATTLLNDKIFQLSPALGIVTNQLIYTTQGMRAFVLAAAPIVAIAGTIIGIVATIAVSIKSAINLESALANVQKTTNLTNNELKQLTSNFQDLSKELPMSSIELLEIATIAGQLGITGVENIQNFTTAIAMLSTATNVVGSQGAESLARFLQATGVASEDLGAMALQVGNVLNRLENTTAATADEILKMTSYTQGLTSQAGATQSQILGLNAAILSLGVQSEAGGSAVVRIVSKIQTAAVDGGEALEAMARASGVTSEEFMKIVDSSPIEALELLSMGMNKIAENGGNLNQVLSDLGINEIRERRTMLALAQGADVLAESIDNANMEAIAMLSLQAEVDIQSNTTAALLQRLGNRFLNLAQNIGTILLPVFKALVEITINLVDSINLLIEPIANFFKRVGSSPLDQYAEDMQEAVSKTNGLIEASRSAEQALGELGQVTGESGLISVLQKFSLSLDEDGREALANFAQGTLAPLLAQGKLQEAILKTIEYFEVQALASKVAVRQAIQDQLDLNAVQLAPVLTGIRNLQGEIEDAKQEYFDLIEGLSTNDYADVSQVDAAREKLILLADQLSRLIESRDELVGQRLEIRADFDQAGQAIADLEEKILALGEATNIEELQQLLSEMFGLIETVGADSTYERSDSDGAKKRTVADVFADLEAAGTAATRKAEAFGNTYDATLQSIQTRSQLVASALDELFEMGLTGADARVQYLIARMTELKDEGEALVRQFEGTESALETLRQRRIAFEAEENPYIITKEDANFFAERNLKLAETLRELDRESQNLTTQYQLGLIPESELVNGQLAIQRQRIDATAERYGWASEQVAALTDQYHEMVDAASDAEREADRVANALERVRLQRVAFESEEDPYIITQEDVDAIQERSERIQEIIKHIEEARDRLIRRLTTPADTIIPGVVNWSERVPASGTPMVDFDETAAEIAADRAEKNLKLANTLRELSQRSEDLALQYELGLIPESELVNGQLEIQRQRIDATAERYGWASEQVAELTSEYHEMTDAAKQATEEAERQAERIVSALETIRLRRAAFEAEEDPYIISEEDAGLVKERAEQVQKELVRIEEAYDRLIRRLTTPSNTRVPGVFDPSQRTPAFTTTMINLDETAAEVAADRAEANLKLADTLRELSRQSEDLTTQHQLGLITSTELVNDQLAIQEQRIAATAERYGWASEQVAELVENYHKMARAIEELEQIRQDRVAFEQEEEDAFVGSVEELRLARMKAEQEAAAKLRDTLKSLEEENENLILQYELGLIPKSELVNGQLNIQERTIVAVAEKFGYASEEVAALVEEYKAMVAALDNSDTLLGRISSALKLLGDSIGGSLGGIVSSSSEVVQAFNDMRTSGGNWADEIKNNTNGVMSSIASLTNAIGNALPEQESFANKAVEGFYAVGGAVLSLFPPFKELGPIVTAMGKVVSRSLGDMANGVKQVRKQLEEAAGSATGLSKDLIDAFGARATERVSRGGFLGFLGFKKSALNQEFFNAMLDTAGSIASGFSQALSSGVQAALSGEQNWAQNFRKGLTKTIVDIIIQAMIDAAIMKGMIQDFIEEFTLLLFDDEGDITTSTLNKALSFAEKNIGSVVSSAERVIQKITNSVKSKFGDVYKEAAGELGFLTEEFVGRLEEAFTETFERQKGRGKKVKTYTVTVFDEEGFAEALNIADTIASGFTSGFREGIRNAISGNQDWKTNLRQSLTDTLMNVIIDSFLQTAIIDGIFGNLMIDFTEQIAKGNIDAALGIIADQLPGVVEDAQRLIEEFVGGLPPELQPDGGLGGTDGRGGAATISEITGPTRDLLLDLLRPLSILPSWTQMIQDIRNDVRAMRLAAVGDLQPAALMTATSAPNLSTSAASTTVFNLSNVTITTNADNVQTLSRDISAYANKQRRGGK